MDGLDVDSLLCDIDGFISSDSSESEDEDLQCSAGDELGSNVESDSDSEDEDSDEEVEEVEVSRPLLVASPPEVLERSIPIVRCPGEKQICNG